MANDLINMKAFEGGPSQAFANLPNESLADGIGSSYGVINYKGKVWSLRYRGEKHTFVRPDDGTPASYIDVVVLQRALPKSKSYYEKWDGGGASEGTRPICASIDGVVPDEDVQQKQADACSLCPRNEWKMQDTGRMGRECQDYKRLAVLLMPLQTKAILGEPLMEPVFLRVPPASLNNLAKMGEQMDHLGHPYISYVTRITFDPTKAHPEMVFHALQKLTDAEAPVVLTLRDDPLALRIIGAPRHLALPAPQVKREALAAPGTNPTGLSTSAPFTKVADASITSGLGMVASAPPATPATQEVISPAKSTIETSASGAFGGVIDVPTATDAGETAQASSQSSPQQTVVDTGEPDEADAALDARIAQLMPKLAS